MSDPSGTKYCGVPVADIVSSLRDAERLLRTGLPYPETQAVLERWLANKPFEKLAVAGNAEEVRKILGDTGTKSLLRTYKSVFEYFALSDKEVSADSGERTGFGVYENLTAWGGFNYWNAIDNPSFYNDALLAEKDAFLAVRYGRMLKEDLSEAQTARLTLYLSREKAARPPESFQAGVSKFDDLHNILSAQGEEAAVLRYLSYSGEERSFVRDALHAMTGFRIRRQLLENLSPFRIYGLTTPRGDQASGRKDYATVKENLKDYLGPRLQNDWVRAAHATGRITYDGGREGVIFHTTPEIASEVAARFSGYEVLDRLGTRILPAKGSSPAP